MEWFLDLIFPVKCLFCGFISKKLVYVCRKCLRSLPVKRTFECIGCKKAVSLGQTCFQCSKDCQIDRLFVASDYTDKKVKKLIKTHKYQFIEDLHGPLYGLVARYLSWLGGQKKFNIFQTNPLMVPVPLSHYRLNSRGFNQAELLCQNISARMQFDFKSDVFIRQRSVAQADIKTKSERQENIKGQLEYIGPNLADRDIILIDDICTTGSTLNECAKILKQNGAGKIYALVVARG